MKRGTITFKITVQVEYLMIKHEILIAVPSFQRKPQCIYGHDDFLLIKNTGPDLVYHLPTCPSSFISLRTSMHSQLDSHQKYVIVIPVGIASSFLDKTVSWTTYQRQATTALASTNHLLMPPPVASLQFAKCPVAVESLADPNTSLVTPKLNQIHYKTKISGNILVDQ